MIGLKCPKCQTVLKVDESKAGTATTCPGCGGAFRIPNLTRPKPGGAQGARGQGSGVRNQASTQAKTAPDKQTAIQPKASKPPFDPSVRPARTSPISPSSSPPEEELEYTLDDIEEEEVPQPPRSVRGRRGEKERGRRDQADVEVEDDVEDEDEEDEDEEEDEYDDEDEDEDEEEDDEGPRVKRKKKKKSGGMSPIPFVAGGIIFVIVTGCTLGGWFLASRKKPPPDPAKAMEMIKARGGNFKQDDSDPAKPVIEVSLMGTDADNGDLEMLRAFPKLKKLDLTRCTKINNVGLEWLEDFKELRVLKMGFCSHVSDGGMEFIGKLTSLEELSLDQTIVTDLGLRDLTKLKNLKKISLSGALASGRGLQAAIPGLEIIQ
jgi:hypothetical protein